MAKIRTTYITLKVMHREDDTVDVLDLYELRRVLDECEAGSMIGDTYEQRHEDVAPEDVAEQLQMMGNDGTFFDSDEDEG